MTKPSPFLRLARTASITALAGAMLTPVHAFAQIDEVITTAQRRVETTQDVPVAVTVLSADDLEVRQIQDTLDIQAFVPNLNLATNTGTSNAARIFLRGIGEDESRGAVEPAVGIYVDGVYYGRALGSLFDLVDLEQIEVLRGPQGTLYGRNSNGGALKISSVKPDTDAFSANGRVTVGNYDRFDMKATVNIPIAETTALRLSGLSTSRDGFFTQNAIGVPGNPTYEGQGAVETLAVRGLLSHDFGNWNVLLSADYTDDDSDPIPGSIPANLDRDGDIFTIEPAPGVDCAPSPSEPTAEAGIFDFRRIGCFAGHESETISQGLSATITGDIGDYTVQTITAFRRLDDELSSYISLPYFQETDQEQISQEVTLSSNLAGPFNFVVGAFYYKEDLNFDTRFVFPFSVASDLESFAVFGQAEYEVGDFTFTGGLRYTDDTREFEGINRGLSLGNADEINEDNVSYTAKVDYQMADELLLYTSYSTGFKGGGFSADCFSPVSCFLPVEEETVDTFEAGFKTQFAENRVRFNGTYFYSAYDGLQISATVPGIGFTRFNVEETTIQGLEFDLVFAPNDRFDLRANLGLLDGEYDELNLAQATALLGPVGTAACPGGVASIDCARDLELKNAPSYKANVAATYYQPVPGGEVVFSGDITFEDDSFNLVSNDPIARSRIPDLSNLRMAYQPDDAFWNVALWVRNVGDRAYNRAATSAGAAPGQAAAVYAAPPRTYGIDIGFEF
ncbi:MAG: TonB-dependent receptor [Pseudomonadota bacterium]